MSVSVQCRWLQSTILRLHLPEFTAPQENSMFWHILRWKRQHNQKFIWRSTVLRRQWATRGVGGKKKERRHTNAVITVSIEIPWNSLRAWIFFRESKWVEKAILHHHWTLDQNTTEEKKQKKTKQQKKAFHLRSVHKKAKPVAFWKKTHPLGYIYIKAL